MELNACLVKYVDLTGRDDIKETVFFEDTPDIVGVYVPGWDFPLRKRVKDMSERPHARPHFTQGKLPLIAKTN